MHDVMARWVPFWLLRQRARLGDVGLAAVVVAIILKMEQTALTGLALAFAGIVAAAVLARRRFPRGSLAVVTALACGTLAVDPPVPGVFIAAGVLLYSAALYSPVRRPWFYARAVFVALMVAGTIFHFTTWWNLNLLGLFAWVFGGAGVGDSIRMRRAYVAAVVERARQAELTREEEARRRVMDERLRIARELHDVVAHHIAVISVHAGAATHALQGQPEKVWPVLGHIREAADTVLDEIKSVISVLRDPGELDSTEPTPGLDRLPELLTTLRTMGFAVRHQQHGDARRLPAVTDLAAYRIVQEALTNAHKYGDGSALLDVTYAPGTVSVQVTNKIAWPRSKATGSGYGLIGMQERASAAGGTVTAGPVAGGWFRVHAVLAAPGLGSAADLDGPADFDDPAGFDGRMSHAVTRGAPA
ncbi:sensor histidine kinase [Actinoplanes sp. L3-i22]|uniref:sensor histidine kinase n=1 Tax=Actinoplanes sp. L3-i22 TaxID=2836373 RepID=UPI001C763ADE|nr:histidine kinase [Actinoplanes sp. L3-i22]BCY09538.1 two-component sensor histidine kinase [Actinoplanes sp. L3-i22]